MTATQNDWILQSFVYMADSFEISITLQVSGMLVSGDIVSIENYTDGIGEEFSNAFGNDLKSGELFKDKLSEFGERFGQTKADQTEIDQQLPRFIHLKNARYFHASGNPIPNNKGVFWRGQISKVSGFFLGNLSTESYTQ